MSPQEVNNWTEAAAKFVVPILFGITMAFTGCSITQVNEMRKDIGDLKVKVAELSMEVKTHVSQTRMQHEEQGDN